MLSAIKYLAIFTVFCFPFVLFKNLAFPLTFSHVVFAFSSIEICVLFYLLHSFERGELKIKRSPIVFAILAYIGILFLTAFTGEEFGYSFWSNYSRATGIITWLHYFAFFAVISTVFRTAEEWRPVLRALALSGLLLATFSFLGRDGLGLQFFAFLKQGGSFLGNTSYSGAYLLLIFFISAIGFFLENKRYWKWLYGISFAVIFFNPDLFNFGILSGTTSLSEAATNPVLLFGMARTSSLVLWAGILLFIILWGLNKLQNKKNVVKIATSITVLLFLIYALAFTFIMKREGKIYDLYLAAESSPVRPMVWEMALEGVKEKPILGYGNGNFKYVYQENLDPEMIHLENPPWFDRAHNFTLEELTSKGVLGILALLAGFIIVATRSFRLYLRDPKFYFLCIPFILILHFFQLQTFFMVDSSLFLMFILLAFLVSREPDRALTFSRNHSFTWQAASLVFILLAFIFFIFMPVKENTLILKAQNTLSRPARLSLAEDLKTLYIDPAETLRQVTEKFMTDTASAARAIEESGFTDNVAEEYRVYIDVYEQYINRYKNYHRYLFEYANLINTAYMFGVDELKKGEDLARDAIEISDLYPHPFWVLAINLYYQGRMDESLEAAKMAYDIDPTIENSKNIYENLKTHVGNSRNKTFLFIPDL